MMNKRGQSAAGAAVLLAVIMGLIIGFIILIPPEERAKILGEEKKDAAVPKDKDTNLTGAVKEVLLKETLGKLSYIREKEIGKVIPASSIFTRTESVILMEMPSALVKKGLFSSQKEELYFELKDPANTKKVLLDFSIDSFKGNLIITLNGQEVFNRETNKISPITLPKHLLQENNYLLFEVSSPGAAFWRSNEYYLRNIKIVAEITDISLQESRQTFYVTPDEAKSIEEANIRFSLSCIQMGKLTVRLNEHQVFSGVPQNCNDLFYYAVPPEAIREGSNWVSFRTEDGNFDVDSSKVMLKLKTPSYPVHYFELDQKYFTEVSGSEEKQLKQGHDVIMTLEFTDEEYKEADIYINGRKISFDTYKVEFTRNINIYMVPWTNSIKIIPLNSFDVKTLKVELKE